MQGTSRQFMRSVQWEGIHHLLYLFRKRKRQSQEVACNSYCACPHDGVKRHMCIWPGCMKKDITSF